MPSIFDKLNLKEQSSIFVLNAPPSFEKEIASLHDVTVSREIKPGLPVTFALAFISKQAELDRLSKLLSAQAEGDAILWFAYPKGTSRRYTCEFNRDTGWEVLRTAGFDTVRQVAIDEDWSALRFRRVEHVKRGR